MTLRFYLAPQVEYVADGLPTRSPMHSTKQAGNNNTCRIRPVENKPGTGNADADAGDVDCKEGPVDDVAT